MNRTLHFPIGLCCGTGWHWKIAALAQVTNPSSEVAVVTPAVLPHREQEGQSGQVPVPSYRGHYKGNCPLRTQLSQFLRLHFFPDVFTLASLGESGTFFNLALALGKPLQGVVYKPLISSYEYILETYYLLLSPLVCSHYLSLTFLFVCFPIA